MAGGSVDVLCIFRVGGRGVGDGANITLNPLHINLILHRLVLGFYFEHANTTRL